MVGGVTTNFHIPGICFPFHVTSISYVPTTSGVNVISYSPSLLDLDGETEHLTLLWPGPVICIAGLPCADMPRAETKNFVNTSTSAFDRPGPHALAIPESTTLKVNGESEKTNV